MSAMMLGARAKGVAIDPRYLAKISSGKQASKTLETLNHLITAHGANPAELLTPAFVVDGDLESSSKPIALSPYGHRIGLEEFESEFARRGYRIESLADPLCSVLTIFERPKPRDKFLKIVGVGTETILSIEAGLSTPSVLSDAFSNSDKTTLSPIIKSMASLGAEEVRTSSRTMTVYMPPDLFITCALVTYVRAVDFLGEERIAHYAAAPAIVRKRKPDDPRCRFRTARILSEDMFPDPL